jgi:ABC-type antimicrobial peptide transport system permease subunit
MLMLDSLIAVGLGLVAGSALAFPASKALGRYLPGLVPDGMTPVVAFVVLGSFAIVAAAAPARRALRIQPTQALRGE